MHLLLLLLYSRHGNLLVVELPSQSAMPDEKRIAFELVETPEDARTDIPPEETNLVSDKNARARDMREGDTGADLPYSEGDLDVKNMPSDATVAQGRPEQPGVESSSETTSSNREYSYQVAPSSSSGSETSFSREALLGRPQRNTRQSSRIRYDQRNNSARDIGGFSLNTYAWDFAPYLLELKDSIQRNVFPPPAFTQLGFGGTNTIQFRINPDGKLEGPWLLNSRGEKALIETSKKAVIFSAPFRPLPKDFPEEYLVVTAKFDYFVMNR